MNSRRQDETNDLRRLLWEQLLTDTADMTDCPTLTFYWEPRRILGAVKWDREARFQIRINLYPLHRRYFPSAGARQFFARFLCGYALEHIRLLLRAPFSAPQSYPEGLAQLEGLYHITSDRRIPLCLPWPGGSDRQDRRYHFTPLNIFCAAPALKRAAEQWGRRLPPEEKQALARAAEELEALAALPEIGYYGSRLPESSLIWTLERAGELLTSLLNTGEIPPVLQTLCGEDGRLCSLEQLTDRLREADEPLGAGIALRLLAFSGGQLPAEVSEKTARQYRENSVRLIKHCGTSAAKALQDDLAAAEKVLANLNRAMANSLPSVCSGTVHPMGFPDRTAFISREWGRENDEQ